MNFGNLAWFSKLLPNNFSDGGAVAVAAVAGTNGGSGGGGGGGGELLTWNIATTCLYLGGPRNGKLLPLRQDINNFYFAARRKLAA
jgi:hypothetical protein